MTQALNFNSNRKADPMLQGKTIIVTGAASGIGAATAALVSSHGAEVISVDINAPDALVGAIHAVILPTDLRLIASWPRYTLGPMVWPTSPDSRRRARPKRF